jgi:phosphate starvation-inducible PhoH-like protein
MGRKMKTPRLTRREKMMQDRTKPATFTPPTETPQMAQMPRLEAKTPNQRTALRYLSEDRPVVFLSGSAGTGKSMLACFRAATLLRSKKIDKIYLVRPAVAVGKSIGLLPGEIDEKMAPYFAQTIAHLEGFLGKGYTKYCLEKKVIEMKPAEYLRGMSFENCFVLVEESQNFTAEEMEMVLTRMGEGSQIVFTGDTKQNDLRTASGLKTTVDMIERMLQTHPEYLDDDDLDAMDDGIGIVKFTPDDVVRSGLTRAFVRMYHHND